MSAIVVATFKTQREAKFVAGLIKRYRANAKVLRSSSIEDLYFGKLIEEGMAEKGEISEKEFFAFLDKKIKSAP